MGHTSKNNDSRWVISITILFLSLTLLGCGGGGSANNTASSSAAIASVVSTCSSTGGHDPYEHVNDPPPYATSGCGTPAYTVSTMASAHGVTSPGSAVVNQGDDASFTVTPDTGYSIDSVSGCGGSLSGNTYTTGPITADCTVAATFISDNTGGGSSSFTVSTTAGSHGVITPGSAVVNQDDATSFTVTPDTGYSIDSVSGCGGSLSGNTYTTGPITADCTVAATFISDNTGGGSSSFTVSTTAGVHGVITPNSAVVNQGDTIIFTITPDAGYLINSVSGCSGSLSGNTYTTAAISADCTVTASFISDGSNTGNNNASGCTPPTTTGTPWVYPCEISVAKAYNTVFLTDAAGGVPYDESTYEGLNDLLAMWQRPTPTSWHAVDSSSINNPNDVTNVIVLLNETPSSNTSTFGVKVGNTFISIYNAGPWTDPTRCWINNPTGNPINECTQQAATPWSAGVVSIPDLLTQHNLPADSTFTFYVANSPDNPPSIYTEMTGNNSHRIEGNGTYNGGFFLAYEEGNDNDYNDLVVYVNSPSGAPGGCMGHKPTILGTPGPDIQVTGTLGNDVIMTFGGTDIIHGYLGDDYICPGDGNDIVFAGGGNDTIFDSSGKNMIFGNAGDDTIYGSKDRDDIHAGSGNDLVYGGGGGDVIYGDSGNDIIYASGGNDVVLGLSGNDEIHGGDGNDKIFGGSGNDKLYGDAGDDRIYPGRGKNQWIEGGDGVDYCAPLLPGDINTSTVLTCE